MTIKKHLQSSIFRDKMYRFAKRILKDSYDAEDVCQDVIVKLWQKKTEFNGHANIEALGFKMVKEKALDKIKHEQVKVDKFSELHQEASVEDSTVESTDLHQITKDLINQLPPKQSMVMHLRDMEDMDIEEIVVIMEMEEQAVRMNLSRARKTVREKLIKIMNYGL